MPFEIDALISFSEKDNQNGWVTQFKKYFESMFHQILGSKITLELKSERDDIKDESFKTVGVMIAILSKDYIQSEKCLETLENFHKNCSTQKNDTNRIFKVLKHSLPNQKQPPLLRELVSYEMFKFDFETNMASEYIDFFSEEASNYWMRMADIMYDIHESLLVIKNIDNKKVKYINNKKTIFLAETSRDLSIQRNIIRRELQRYGYKVLPDKMLPLKTKELQSTILSDLEQCSLSIHLIGNAYGEIPVDSEKSVVEIQNRISAEYSANRKRMNEEFPRLIWITPNIQNISDIQKKFIDSIQRDTEAQEGAEILQTPLEDFKNIMREELLSEATNNNIPKLSSKSIYLVHDKIDLQEVSPIINLIKKSGFSVLLPTFDGDLIEIRKKHIQNLRTLDGAIIFKGKVNDNWVRMKVLDLLKAPGFGRTKKIQGKAILSKSSLDQYKNQNLTLLMGKDSESESSIKNFLNELNS